MMYAVIRIAGNQYRVNEGDEIAVNKVSEDRLNPEVLMLNDEGKVTIGKPVLGNVKLNIKIVNPQVKGDKITIVKYKAKSRYRKKAGFTPVYTRLLIEKISYNY